MTSDALTMAVTSLPSVAEVADRFHGDRGDQAHASASSTRLAIASPSLMAVTRAGIWSTSAQLHYWLLPLAMADDISGITAFFSGRTSGDNCFTTLQAARMRGTRTGGDASAAAI